MNALSVEGLSKRYHVGGSRTTFSWLTGYQRLLRLERAKRKKASRIREIWALRRLSFEVERGGVVGIIGPNGAGKSTLLKVLGRVTPPTEGRAIVRGRVVPLLEVGAGFQQELSGRENVYLHAALYGIPRAEVERRFDEIVEFAGLEAFIDAPVRRYSSGMYLRLAFSVAINMDPDILLADEVLAVGDIEFQERCLRRVGESGAAGLTVLFVSHDMAAVRRLCRRVIWLNAGQVVADGDPETVVAQYEQSSLDLVRGRVKDGVGSHVNEHGEILYVRLLSADGEQIGAVRISERVMLEIAFAITTPGVQIRCSVDVHSRGTLAFRTVQPQPMRIDEPGVFYGTVTIPPDLLSDRLYSVNAAVLLEADGVERPLVEYNAVAFQAYAGGDETVLGQAGIKSRLAGVLSPRLEWAVTAERDVVSV